MKFTYKAYSEDDGKPFEGIEINDSRKIKDLITINITIEMEASKYEQIKKKYKNPISEKVRSIFK